jgi:hypothetical protein
MAKYVAINNFDDWGSGPGADWNNEAMPRLLLMFLLGTAVFRPAAEKATQLGYS